MYILIEFMCHFSYAVYKVIIIIKMTFFGENVQIVDLAPKIILTEFSSQFHRLSKFSKHLLNFNPKNSVFEIIRKKSDFIH